MNVETKISAVRAPQQGRSRASFERMLIAAEELMSERGTDDFTLNEVGKRGKVSIGSIYCRFDSKDDLVHAVQTRVLERVNAEQLAMVESARTEASDLVILVDRLVEGTAESLRRFADVTRPFMIRASTDTVVAAQGKARYAEIADAVCAALLEHSAEIAQPDAERAVHSAYRILYSSIARYLGFGSTMGSAWDGDWQILKEDLARMIAAFLTTSPRIA
ncbi:TetR/AcrR family transcriptional regulator [Sphingomonas sp. 10B4]|uniref:TetR/AcrR family transcriptional regulator n=1 Tax=Sphingomonas sp. 10B4 TaxID=3048575 RepID=UPI002AB3ADFF|nr:TetR/AcrR family transcriptional regulator [Sphingomonas sp. 10B4]MDY7525995.1 TetR/AcrR family transcriptional regulator [Sphingomonas sp. 10B4]MEB0283242.1 TetR/AcrR family transcriptional regulator [Sphingomonas sp. 10B4]